MRHDKLHLQLGQMHELKIVNSHYYYFFDNLELLEHCEEQQQQQMLQCVI